MAAWHHCKVDLASDRAPQHSVRQAPAVVRVRVRGGVRVRVRVRVRVSTM